jgi:hypothetical protein
MRKYLHIDTFFLLRSAFKEDDSTFVEAIKMMMLITRGRIVVITKGATTDSELVNMLLDVGIMNVVTAESGAELQDEILETLSEGGMMRRTQAVEVGEGAICATETHSAEVRVVQPRYTANGALLAFCGSAHKMGTTTMALNLAYHIKEYGGKVCFVQNDGSGHLDVIAKVYAQLPETHQTLMPIRKFEIDGMDLYSAECIDDVPKEDYDFIIVDCGSLMNGKSDGLVAADKRYLVAGTLPYELPLIANAEASLKEMPFTLLPLAVPDEFAAELLQQFRSAVFLSPSNTLFDGHCNDLAFSRLLEEYRFKR